MYTTIIIFYVSLAGICLMLLMKRSEAAGGTKKSLLSRMFRGMDHFVHAVYEGFRFVISHVNVHNGIVACQWIAFHVLSWVRSLYVHTRALAHRHPHSKKVIDMVTGKGQVHQNGGASFYLKRIGHEGKK